jgi:hypothetical protein
VSKKSITDQNVILELVQYVLHPLQQNGTYSQGNSALSPSKHCYYFFFFVSENFNLRFADTLKIIFVT